MLTHCDSSDRKAMWVWFAQANIRWKWTLTSEPTVCRLANSLWVAWASWIWCKNCSKAENLMNLLKSESKIFWKQKISNVGRNRNTILRIWKIYIIHLSSYRFSYTSFCCVSISMFLFTHCVTFDSQIEDEWGCLGSVNRVFFSTRLSRVHDLCSFWEF